MQPAPAKRQPISADNKSPVPGCCFSCYEDEHRFLELLEKEVPAAEGSQMQAGVAPTRHRLAVAATPGAPGKGEAQRVSRTGSLACLRLWMLTRSASSWSTARFGSPRPRIRGGGFGGCEVKDSS